jgi:hypothetical protein
MTGLEIIKEIRRLPPEERAMVIKFTRENLEDGQLSGAEIGELARQMVDAKDAAEADRLRAEIVKGFFGVLSCPRRFCNTCSIVSQNAKSVTFKFRNYQSGSLQTLKFLQASGSNGSAVLQFAAKANS